MLIDFHLNPALQLSALADAAVALICREAALTSPGAVMCWLRSN
jgi:hypothetical protein